MVREQQCMKRGAFMALINMLILYGMRWMKSERPSLPDVPLEAESTAVILAIIILATIIGNVLVIISVFTYRPLPERPKHVHRVSGGRGHHSRHPGDAPECRLHPHVLVEVRITRLQDVAHVRRPVLHGLHPAPLRHRPGQVLVDSRSHELRQQEDSEEGAHHDCCRLGGQHDHLCPIPHRMERLARGLHGRDALHAHRGERLRHILRERLPSTYH
ncbi:hypothetical protein CEXT_103621 [Caerostris extrusa]|uniref:Uncharacterized protein n=1 Tax=Caerostris extrusa TaxID=172846 RepID=A0AAV4TXN6_CAEEX|nr:hypothetical protein CEXT_103621 [Caerostris extrusa]